MPENETPVNDTTNKRFAVFRDSGIGQFAEALWVLQQEHPKKFWIFFFLQLWFMANGINHIADLWTLVEKGQSVFTLFNPFAG